MKIDGLTVDIETYDDTTISPFGMFSDIPPATHAYTYVPEPKQYFGCVREDELLLDTIAKTEDESKRLTMGQYDYIVPYVVDDDKSRWDQFSEKGFEVKPIEILVKNRS